MFFFSVLLQIICKKVFFSDSKRWALQLDAHHEILYHKMETLAKNTTNIFSQTLMKINL